MKKTFWVVVANGSEAKIFQTPHVGHNMQLVKQLQHPESREKDTDLVSDRYGHNQQMIGGHATYAEQTDPKEVEIDKFAREISRLLDHARMENSYQQLVLVAPPHFMGLLKKHCHSNVKDLIYRDIEKDYIKLSHKDLEHSLQQHFPY